MANGDVWVAYAWQGTYATLLGKGVPVAYADPKEGRNSWVGVYGIRKGAPNPELALKFLDDKLANATSTNVVNQFYYGTSNQEVMKAHHRPDAQADVLDRRSDRPAADQLYAEPDRQAARRLDRDVDRSESRALSCSIGSAKRAGPRGAESMRLPC